MKKILILLTFLMGTVTYVSSAQSASDRTSIKNTLGIGPRLGYYKAKDADEGNFLGGIQARLRLGAVIGIEGAVEYRAGQEYGTDQNSLKTSFIPVTGSVLLFAPISESFAPYGIAGIGAYYTRYDYESSLVELEDDSEFNMGYHLGFGVELPFNENVALNVDYRYLFLNPNTNEESFEDADFGGNVVSAGLMFYF